MSLYGVDTVKVGGISTACLGRRQLASLIAEQCHHISPAGNSSMPILVFSNNAHAISIANRDEHTMRLLGEAEIIHADGQSVVAFSKLRRGRIIPERSATTDMIHDIPSIIAEPIKHFLLGGKERVVKKAATVLARKYSNFLVCGAMHGYFSESDELAICKQINESGAQILWVGLGKPAEQEFCVRNRDKLDVAVVITCGGCFNFVTGEYARAPLWLQNYGLEWLHRMVTNPRKLFWRYFITNPHALWIVIKEQFFKP